MKKVVRLTESDLIKIVKKVLKEQKNDGTIIKKAKVFNTNNELITNIDIYDAKINGVIVDFSYSKAGRNGWRLPEYGTFSCGDSSVQLEGGQDRIKFSKETTEWFMSYCNQYSQNNSSTKQTNTSSYV